MYHQVASTKVIQDTSVLRGFSEGTPVFRTFLFNHFIKILKKIYDKKKYILTVSYDKYQEGTYSDIGSYYYYYCPRGTYRNNNQAHCIQIHMGILCTKCLEGTYSIIDSSSF